VMLFDVERPECQFPCCPEFRTSVMSCSGTYSLCPAYSLDILSFDFHVFRPKSSKNMHLYHAVVCRKQFCSGFWSSPWDYMDIRYTDLTVSGTPV
jgi:hypothetical protein